MFRRTARAAALVGLAGLAYIALGGVLAATGGAGMRGELVDIGGRRLRIVCEGPRSGRPTVVFESGAFGFAADWAVVQARLAAQGVHSCAYDRAGLGFSDAGPRPRDARAVVADLAALLSAAGEPGPYVLVGHSMAGLAVRLFALSHPAQVRGVVLVDAATPEAMDLAVARTFVRRFSGLARVAGWAAGGGLLKPLGPLIGDAIGLDGEAKAEKQRVFGLAGHNRWAAEEVANWARSSHQARDAGAYDPALPLAVITAGAETRGNSGWKAVQAAPARASRRGYVEHVVGANHANLLGVRHADAIVRGIDHVLAAR